MSIKFWLTNEDADISGYKKLKLGGRSESFSLVRTTVPTVAGPTSGIVAGSWMTDPLNAAALGTSAWLFSIWAYEADLAANAALRYQVLKYTAEAGESTVVLDDAPGTELTTVTRSSGRTSIGATSVTLADGDRLVLKILVDDATSGSMAAGSVVISYNGNRPRIEGDSYITAPDDLSLTAQLPPSTRTQIRRLIDDVSSTSASLSDHTIDQSWSEALDEYTRDRPQMELGYLNGDGTAFDFDLPSRWIHGISDLANIEYPLGMQTRSVLEPDDWELIDSVVGGQPTRRLHFKVIVPEPGTSNIRLWYTTRHIHTDEENTIPHEDLTSVVCLAASYACLILAARAAGSTEPTIHADSVNHRDGEQRWRLVAKELRDRYLKRITSTGATVGAASATRDWDITPALGGDWLMRRNRLR